MRNFALEGPDRRRYFLRSRPVAIGVMAPAARTEIRRLGRTLKQRAVDALAYFERPGTSNGPTEALNGRLEHRHGIALGFRNLTN